MNTHARLVAIFSVLALTAYPCTSALAEEALGRLFFTPERRQALDHQRQFNIQERQEATEDPTFTIDGVVTRSSGIRTIWVNGATFGEGDSSSNINIAPVRKNPGQVVIQADEAASTAAKVGDTVNRDTGETTDLLNGGSIVIRRSSLSR